MSKIRKALQLALLIPALLFWAQPLVHAYSFAPTNGSMTSPFGWRFDPFTGGQRFHGGIDIAASAGTPVYVTQTGLVTFSGYYGGYGNIVVINHGNSLYTLYGHNSRLLVQTGQPVYRGQIIALVGSTGRSTGPHLHFEVHYRQQYVNPLTYLGYLQQQSPLMAVASPVSRDISKKQPVTPPKKVATKPKKQAPKAASVRRTYHATVQLVNGTQIKKLRF